MSILESIDADGTRRIGGILFQPKRRARVPVQPLKAPREFLDGLNLAFMFDQVHQKDIASEHNYGSTWVSNLIRELGNGERKATTVEMIVMLRESLPWLDYQMSIGMVEWPALVSFVDYRDIRPGVQPDERVLVQKKRRGVGQ